MKAGRARQIADAPVAVLVLLLAGLALQIAWHGSRPAPLAKAQDLPAPANIATLRLLSLGDEVALAKLLMLWLQAFDYQPGVSIPFRDLDYDKVEGWLGRIVELDPAGQYPLLAASRQYAEVPVEAKQRQMLDFVYRQFLKDPDRRWRWLAHAAIIAKHRLKDLPLALKYSRAITDKATGSEVPAWARDMSVIILEDMGELKSARLLIDRLFESGRITDPHEARFLAKKIVELERKLSEE